jgi:hypothetical protein
MSVVLNKKPEDMDVIEAMELTVMCQELHCLPSAGGLLDQDSYHVWIMNLVTSAQAERAALDRKKMDRQAR